MSRLTALGLGGSHVRRVLAWLRAREPIELAGPLTLILLLLYPSRVPEVRAALQLGCVAGLLYRPLQRIPAYWVLLAALMGVGCLLVWHDADNHKYLLAYWCLALGLSRAATDATGALRLNARLLVGLPFLLAVLWKIRTPDFVTGEFFEFALLTDDRLFGLAQLATEMEPDVYFENRAAIDRLTGYASTTQSVALQGVAAVRPLAAVLTGWTLAIEAWVAAAFLWPGEGKWVLRSRDVSLLVFALTTYFATTVSGFAWLLLIMGLAQVSTERAGWRLAYLACPGVVILYQLDLVSGLLIMPRGSPGGINWAGFVRGHDRTHSNRLASAL